MVLSNLRQLLAEGWKIKDVSDEKNNDVVPIETNQMDLHQSSLMRK